MLYTTSNRLRSGRYSGWDHARSAQQRDREGWPDRPLGRSGLNRQTKSTGSSGASDRPDPIIFQVSRPGPTRWRSGPGHGRVLTHCNVKMIYESVLAQYLVIICISFVLSTTENVLPPHSQEKSMCNLTMLMIVIICLFQTAKGLSRKSGWPS
jgi:hypothetical protein